MSHALSRACMHEDVICKDAEKIMSPLKFVMPKKIFLLSN